MGITEKIAEFVVKTDYPDIPIRAIDLAKRSVLDTLASALAGSIEPGCQAIKHYIGALGGKPEAGIIGGGFYTSAPDAAMANGYLAHLLDYDDCGIKIGHPSVLVLPAVLALADKLQTSGKAVLTAYIIGLEVQGKMALRCDLNLIKQSLDIQCFFGCIGSASAAAKMLGLDVHQTRVALGIAVTMACSPRGNRGTMMIPMTAGNVCRAGVAAGLLAQGGISASPDIIETENGLSHTIAGPNHRFLEGIAEELGHPFYIISPGIGLKKYPSCYHTHRSIDALLLLMAQHQLVYEDIVEVEVATSKRALQVLSYHQPSTPYQAKYSMPYVIGCAMLDREINLKTFTEEKLSDPEVCKALKKVRVTLSDLPIWPGLAALNIDTKFVGNPVTIQTKTGHCYTTRVDTLRGDPALPLTDEVLLSKFLDCARLVLSPKEIQKSSDWVLHMDELPNIRKIMDLLTKSGTKRIRREIKPGQTAQLSKRFAIKKNRPASSGRKSQTAP